MYTWIGKTAWSSMRRTHIRNMSSHVFVWHVHVCARSLTVRYVSVLYVQFKDEKNNKYEEIKTNFFVVFGIACVWANS